LEERSNSITEGLIMRSKVQWFEQGEKSKMHIRKLLKVRNWLKSAQIKFPRCNLENILSGINVDIHQYFLFLLWKFTLYKARENKKLPTLIDFQLIISNYEKMEYSVAKRKFRLVSNLKKYEKK